MKSPRRRIERLVMRFRGELAALSAGALTPLAFAPLDYYLIALLSPAVLFRLWLNSTTAAEALRRGFAFGLGWFGVGVSWVFVAIHVYGQSPLFVALGMTLLLVAALALYPALAGYLAYRLKLRFALSAVTSLLLLYPLTWVVMEWLRGHLFTGFPWLSLGYSQVDGPLAGWAPLIGADGIALILVLSAGGLMALFYISTLQRMALAFSLALLWGGGWVVAQYDWVEPEGAPIRATVIQGNLSQITKWDSYEVSKRLNTYADMTLNELEQTDLIVWPENSITVFYHQLETDYFSWLRRGIEESAADIDVVLGVPLLDEDGESYYTTMMKLGESPQFYKKHHLVPFGEYVPFAALLRHLNGIFDLPMSSFSSGPQQQPPLQVVGREAGVTICFEDLFVEEVMKPLPGATLLINGSNNAWYGDSLAPHQHLQISRMRAMETGRPLIRATTTGISAFIDDKGHILGASQPFERQSLSASVQPMQGVTPYVAWRKAWSELF